MRVFHCGHCQNLVFFENIVCIQCGHTLAFLPEIGMISSLDAVSSSEWKSSLTGSLYRLCENYSQHQTCNWAIRAEDPNELCLSCRLTQVIPNLPEHTEAWQKLERAKRRLVYSLLTLGCPIESRDDDPDQGLAYKFLADSPMLDEAPVFTGHSSGIITVNIAEADDVERERRRCALHEPYRTLLGHFRHEIGHYYWDRLIKDSPRIDAFRAAFGDERVDYAAALDNHYQQGPAPDWPESFVSAYASVHPWEDWAETWAHYLHLTDTLEIAADSGLSLRPRRSDEPRLEMRHTIRQSHPFERLIDNWLSLTYLLNNLNRGLGLPDGYPFVLSPPAISKLRLVHETICDLNKEESLSGTIGAYRRQCESGNSPEKSELANVGA